MGAGDMRDIKLCEGLPFEIPEIVDVVDTLPKGAKYPWPMRYRNAIKYIVVHHFASEGSLLANANFHINGRGWASLAYHLVLDSGQLKQCNNLLHRTSHCAGYNDNSVSISIRADLSKRQLTPFERQSLYAGIITLKKLFPGAEVRGHYECSKTSCPIISMDQVRKDVEHIEETMAYASTEGAEAVRYFTAVKRIEGLGKALEGPYTKESLRKLNLLLHIGQSIDLVDNTPEGLIKRVIECYNNMSNIKYAQESRRKMKIICDELERLKFI